MGWGVGRKKGEGSTSGLTRLGLLRGKEAVSSVWGLADLSHLSCPPSRENKQEEKPETKKKDMYLVGDAVGLTPGWLITSCL